MASEAKSILAAIVLTRRGKWVTGISLWVRLFFLACSSCIKAWILVWDTARRARVKAGFRCKAWSVTDFLQLHGLKPISIKEEDGAYGRSSWIQCAPKPFLNSASNLGLRSAKGSPLHFSSVHCFTSISPVENAHSI